ncbi:MAG: hypothetical protein O7J95_10465 [Planctomycetota bacterium]|nr:hypothetical protein [Planctomycetota bacterium]
MSANEQQYPQGATTIFILGLLGILLCQILGIIAWVQGNTYMAECKTRGVEPEGLAVAGRILGIVSVVLLILTVVVIVLVIIVGVVAGT